MNRFCARRIGIAGWLGVLLLFAVLALADDGGQRVVRLGVLAKRGTARCMEKWGPTADYLSEQIEDCHFELVPLAFSAIRDAVAGQQIDFILANSAIYVELEMAFGVNGIATMETLHEGSICNQFGGVVFTRRDKDDIATIQDLKGTTFMAVEPTSFGGWQMAWRLMDEQGLEPEKDFELLFGGTHDAVVQTVLAGEADAGTVRTDTLESMAREGKIDINQLKLIHPQDYVQIGFPLLCSTQLYPEWPFARLPQVPDELAGQVAIALMKMPVIAAAARAAHIAGWSPPLSYQPVHDCLKALHVGAYEGYGRISLKHILQEYGYWMLGALLLVLLLAGIAVYTVMLNHKFRMAGDALMLELFERQRAERDVRQIFNTAGDGMRVLYKDRTIKEVNERFCEMTKIPRDEFVGKKCMDFAHCTTECETDACSLMETVTSGERIEKDVMISCGDGSELPCILTSVPYYDAEGRIAGVIQNFKDISDRKLAQSIQEDDAVQRGKIEMVGSVLHDIGNAITGIGTVSVSCLNNVDWPELASLARLEGLLSKKQTELGEALGADKARMLLGFVQKLETSLGSRRDRLEVQFQKMTQSVTHINDILTLQRSYANSASVQTDQQTDIKTVLRDALSMQADSLEKRAVKANCIWPDGAIWLKADRTRLVQVLMNLIKNSLESFDVCEREEGRSLEVSLSVDSDGLHLTLTDNAAGFDAETGAHLFENGFSTKNRDSGMGLYQCRSIVESHGGMLWLSSPGTEQGATAHIELPIQE